MSGKHIAAIVWALIAFVLAPAPARAQETEDSPAPPGPAAGKPTPRPPAPEGSVVAGSFPRSFVIPGTDVSLRIGGLVTGSVLWYLKGANTGGALNNTGGSSENYTEGQGSNGNLASIPLNGVPAPGAVGFAHSRSSTWDFSGKTSRFFLDARGPSPYGEVKGYVELDFGAVNPFTDLNNNRSSVNGYIARFRQGYAALGGLLVGQTQGTFTDNDSLPELLDFNGQTGINFVARTPQVRYTYALGHGVTIAIAAENPTPSVAGPFGPYLTDTNQIPNIGSCAALTTPATSVRPGRQRLAGPRARRTSQMRASAAARSSTPCKTLCPISFCAAVSRSPGGTCRLVWQRSATR
jgi:hypothetical protein